MRKISIFIPALLGLVTLFSCEKEGDLVYLGSSPVNPALTSPAAGSSLVLTQANNDNEISFVWSEADYDFPASINYTVQIDKEGNNFKSAANLGTVNNNDTLKITVNDLNNKILGMLPDPEAAAATAVELRVISLINENVDTLFSSTTKMSITPYYIPIVYSKLWVPGDYQGASGYVGDWSPANAPILASLKGDGKYEGYVYFNSASKFKFTTAPDWDHTNYGDGGAGKISSTGGDISAITAQGYYKLNVNTSNTTWSFMKTEWGLIGDATPNGWDADQNMSYDLTTKVWTITLDLKVGAIKFRANDDWALNYGSNLGTGKLDAGGTDISISTAGNYTVTLDLSNPPIYRYKVVKN